MDGRVKPGHDEDGPPGIYVESWKPLETALWVVATFWAKASRLAALLPSSCCTVAVEAGGEEVAAVPVEEVGAADGVERPTK